MSMNVNTHKTKIMIIKSTKDTYANFIYDNLGIDIHHKLNWNYNIEKMINEGVGWKDYFDIENNCKSSNMLMWDKNKFIFETLVPLVILYDCEVWGCNTS